MKTPSVSDGQRFDFLQVHLDAGGERRFDLLQGIAKGGDVEVHADRLPHGAGPIDVTAQMQRIGQECAMGASAGSSGDEAGAGVWRRRSSTRIPTTAKRVSTAPTRSASLRTSPPSSLTSLQCGPGVGSSRPRSVPGVGRANYLRVFLDRGANRTTAPDGIGARVSIRVGEGAQHRFIGGSVYLGSSELSQPTSASAPRR